MIVLKQLANRFSVERTIPIVNNRLAPATTTPTLFVLNVAHHETFLYRVR